MAKKTPWTPPAKLQPVTAAIYAMLRVYIDTGHLAVQHFVQMKNEGCKEECWVDPQPTCEVMARTFYKFVSTSAVPLAPAQEFAKVYYPDDAASLPAESRVTVLEREDVERLQAEVCRAVHDVAGAPARVCGRVRGDDGHTRDPNLGLHAVTRGPVLRLRTISQLDNKMPGSPTRVTCASTPRAALGARTGRQLRCADMTALRPA